MAQVFYIKQGDQLPVLAATLLDGTHTAVPLDTATQVRFHMKPFTTGGAGPTIDSPMTIVEPLAGRVQYAWAASDTVTPGTFKAEVEVTINNKTETFPNDGDFLVIIPPQVS